MEFTRLDDFFSDGLVTVEDAKIEERLQFYKKCQKDKKKLSFKFSGVSDGDLFIEDNGIRVVLPKDERVISELSMAPSLRIDYEVVVIDVDDVNKEVVVSSKQVKAKVKWEYNRLIQKHLSSNKAVVVRCKVVYVDDKNKRVIVDLAGAGIKGHVPIEEWRNSYVYSLKKIVNVGDIITVAVIKKSPNTEIGYVCSRKKVTDITCWDKIEERFPLDSAVKVKCVYLGKHEWYGSIDGLSSEIEAYVPFPDEETGIVVKIGNEYMCRVYKVSESEHQLRCRVIKELKA